MQTPSPPRCLCRGQLPWLVPYAWHSLLAAVRDVKHGREAAASRGQQSAAGRRLATGGAECNTSAVLPACCAVHRPSPARLFTCINAPSPSPPNPLQYKLNERSVGWEQYNRRLEQYNILVKARNFLVFQVGAAGVPATGWPGLAAGLAAETADMAALLLHCCSPPTTCRSPPAIPAQCSAPPSHLPLQGDIENVAQMQPRDLTNLFEHISGSAAYRQQVGGTSAGFLGLCSPVAQPALAAAPCAVQHAVPYDVRRAAAPSPLCTHPVWHTCHLRPAVRGAGEAQGRGRGEGDLHLLPQESHHPG